MPQRTDPDREPIGAAGSAVDDLLERAEALLLAGQPEQAESMCRSLGRECAPAVYALGTLAFQRNDLATAAQLFRTTELLAPDIAEFCIGSARALLAIGDPGGCIERTGVALTLDPSLTLAHRLAGDAHSVLGQHDEACRHLTWVIEEEPRNWAAWNALGLARLHMGEVDAAIQAFRTALDLQPGFAAACANLGVALENHGFGSEGLRARRRARDMAPEAPDVNAAYLFALNASPEPTSLEIWDEHRRWGAELVRICDERAPSHHNVAEPGRKLRVGYLSADFRQHAVAFFMVPILTHHDHSVVEVHCYVDEKKGDDTSFQLRRHADHWTPITGSSDVAVVERVRADAIDILVDLAGHTAGSRLGVFARQAAPIQVTYLGYPNTTGLPTIQYRITDRWADPPGTTEHLHSEELVRPSASFLCYAPPTGAPSVAAPPVFERGVITFGSFNRGRKINDWAVSVWSRLLNAVPTARLLLKPGPVDRAALQARFARYGVGADRIDIVDYAPGIIGHLAAYASVDVALDTFPYHGTTTTCEALWMGVPVVTLAGCDHRSRVGVSLLQSLGLEDLIAQTPDEYVDRALDLAQDTEKLRARRASQRELMLRSPLMDAPRFTRDLEAAYRTMWRAWCEKRGGAR